MFTYHIPLLIGQCCSEKKASVKCHDSGIIFQIHLSQIKREGWGEIPVSYHVPGNALPVLKLQKSDRTYCIIDGTVTDDGAVFEMPGQAFAAKGRGHAEVSLYDPEGKRITSATFPIDVCPEALDNSTEESKPYLDMLGSQVKAAEKAESGAVSAKSDAEKAAESAGNSAERAEQAAGSSGYMTFEINANGELIYTRTANVNVEFELKEGDLILHG